MVLSVVAASLLAVIGLEEMLWFSANTKTLIVISLCLLCLSAWVILVGNFFWKLLTNKGKMSFYAAANLIGKRTESVNDRLVNLVQLTEFDSESDLLEASVNQKVEQLLPYDFDQAIPWRSTYRKVYSFLPAVVLFLLIVALGGWPNFVAGLGRVVNFSESFEPPPPYVFVVENESLEVVANTDFQLSIAVVGDQLPDRVFISTSEDRYEMRLSRNGNFVFVFENLTEDLAVIVESEIVQSDPFNIKVVQPPRLVDIHLRLRYPAHVKRPDEQLQSFQNLVVPEGTRIELKLTADHTDSLTINANSDPIEVVRNQDLFTASWMVYNNTAVELALSSKKLKNYETYQFDMRAVRDAFPEISLETATDKLNWNELEFVGMASDDYAVVDLRLEYELIDNDNSLEAVEFEAPSASVVPFEATFPGGLDLEEGRTYQVRFSATDNDGVNGGKTSRTQWFRYGVLTSEEMRDELVRRQNEAITGLESIAKQRETDRSALEDLQRTQLERAQLSFSETQQLREAIERQRQQDALMKAFNETTKKSLESQKTDTPNDPMNEALKKRIEEQERALDNNEKLRDEIEKYAEKLGDLEMSDRLEQLSQQQQNAQKSMAQVLELTKRYYVSQKAAQIGKSLEQLAEQQEELSEAGVSEQSAKSQDDLNRSFEDLEREMDALEKENKALKKPFDMKRDRATEDSVEKNQQSALDQLMQERSAKTPQSKAAAGMRKLSQTMNQLPMGGGGQQISEDTTMLRQILDNLLRFSFNQESLMTKFELPEDLSSDFANLLQSQQDLKSNFKHVDDSLFVLSLRQPMLSERINTEVANIYYFIDKALEQFADSQISEGTASQQFVMNATNILADQLSDMLDNLNMQLSPNSGQGDGDMQLPDIIMSQEQLAERMGGEKESQTEDGQKPANGENNGKSSQGSEGREGQGGLDTYEIYKEQQRLREALEELMDANGSGGQGQKLLNDMELLERDILENSQSEGLKMRMQNLVYELLKFESAAQVQGQDDQRESTTGTGIYNTDNQIFKLTKGANTTIERLNRDRLPLRPRMTTKVNQYFIIDND